MSIDFSKAPEGATHYTPADGGVDWYSAGVGSVFRWSWDWDLWVESSFPPEAAKIPRVQNDLPSRCNPPTGSKHDSGKPLMGAVPPNALLAVAKVLTFGAEKYGRDNWRQVENAETRYLDAALRHINAYQRGEAVDLESGESHLAHAVCSLMFMLELQS